VGKIEYSVFIDFDGTITKTDVCEAMVTAFAGRGWEEINRRWEEKEISTVECARLTFKLFKATWKEDLDKLIDGIEVDENFKGFVNFCKEREYPVYILSDGYDLYIESVLKREGLDLPYYANKLVLEPEIDIIAPYQSISCELCGVCKTEVMNKLRKPEHKTIYIGDGYSDFCPARHADLVFAKGVLFEHCSSAGKETVRFSNFRDIINELQKREVSA
jgi:2,3-diketo-5-methylthio-1-phosphopentane phosphatase